MAHSMLHDTASYIHDQSCPLRPLEEKKRSILAFEVFPFQLIIHHLSLLCILIALSFLFRTGRMEAPPSLSIKKTAIFGT